VDDVGQVEAADDLVVEVTDLRAPGSGSRVVLAPPQAPAAARGGLARRPTWRIWAVAGGVLLVLAGILISSPELRTGTVLLLTGARPQAVGASCVKAIGVVYYTPVSTPELFILPGITACCTLLQLAEAAALWRLPRRLGQARWRPWLALVPALGGIWSGWLTVHASALMWQLAHPACDLTMFSPGGVVATPFVLSIDALYLLVLLTVLASYVLALGGFVALCVGGTRPLLRQPASAMASRR
jgi:hypothetical protein